MEQCSNLPLSGHVSIASGNTEEEGVVVDENVRRDDGIVWLRGSMHLGENFLRQRLGNPTDRCQRPLEIYQS